MKKKQRRMAALLAGVLLLTAGCGKRPDPVQKIPETLPVTEPAEEVSPEAALNALCQTMVGTSRLFAVACFGYWEGEDPMEILRETAPQLCADLPFLTEIPPDRIIGQSGDLFCIVPLDADATVAVSKGYWDEEYQLYIYDDILYSSNTGEPILLLCNSSGWEPDCQLYISGPSGELIWYPQTDEKEPFRQFMLKPEDAPEPADMIGSWGLEWTEVEGYQTDEARDTVWIEIFSDPSGRLLMNYTSWEFPDKNFCDEPLTVVERELYFGCGNREWTAELSYVGPFDTTYSLTLTEDNILIKQNYFLLDGAPSVSYEFFSPAWD